MIESPSLIHFFTPSARLLDQLGHQAGPTDLMAGTQSDTVVAVKVFIFTFRM
jgi:hypothetical protein